MTKQERISAVSQQQPLDGLLRNSSLLLRELGGVVAQLETQVLQDIARLKANNASFAVLQSIDLLTQSLAEMDGTLERLAGAVPASVAVDADLVLGPVKLAHLRRMLADDATPLPPATGSAASPDIALFE